MPIQITPIKVEKTLDKIWVTNFISESLAPESAVSLRMSILPYAIVPGSTPDEFGEYPVKDTGDEIWLDPVNLAEELMADHDALVAYQGVLAWIGRLAKRQGKIK